MRVPIWQLLFRLERSPRWRKAGANERGTLAIIVLGTRSNRRQF